MTATTTVDAGSGKAFDAYLSRPSQANGHAVIVLQEIFGVTDAVRGVADRFAEDGYLALAPDLFWREAPGIQLGHSKADIARAFTLVGRYQDSFGMDDVRATVQHIRGMDAFSGKVAVAGMCLGGKLAFLSATLSEVDAAVCFYGVGIEHCLQYVPALQAPLMLHFGDQDPYIPAEARAKIFDALSGNLAVTLHDYSNAGHGFYTRGAPADIALARQRTNDFLQRVVQA